MPTRTLSRAFEGPAVETTTPRGNLSQGDTPFKLRDKEDDNVITQAVLALGQIGPDAKEATPFLMELIQDQDKYVRLRAAIALVGLCQQIETAQSVLTEALKDHTIIDRAGLIPKALENSKGCQK